MTISAVDCHYSITGSGPPLFLTHGIGAAEDAWRFMVPELSKHFSVVIIAFQKMHSLCSLLLRWVQRQQQQQQQHQ